MLPWELINIYILYTHTHIYILHVSAMWPGNVTLVPHHEPDPDYYRRCYNVSSEKGELFVTIQLNPLPAYDCISAMDVSLNVSDVEGCRRYMMYEVSAIPIAGTSISMASCIPTSEESHALFSYCRYRCAPAVNLAFGWKDSSRLQSGMTFCDLRWNYETC